MKHRTKLAFLAAASLLLGACSGLTPSGLIAASRLDPLNTPPDSIAAAIGGPDALRLQDGDASFRIALKGDGPDGPMLVEEAVPLEINPAAPGAPLSNASDEVVFVGTFADEDARRIAAAQAEITRLRSSGIDGQGSISVELVGGCYVDAPPDDLAYSTWLRTDFTDGFVATTRRLDAEEALGADTVALLLSQMPKCEG